MNKYIIIDEQGGGFCHWTWEEPQTRAEILQLFRSLARDSDIDTIPTNFRIITDIWQVLICPVDIPIVKCPGCKCPMRKDKCPECQKSWFVTI